MMITIFSGRCRLWVVFGFWLVCATAIAKPATKEDARRHFEQGIALFNDGNFDAAVAEFQAAFDMHPNPKLLYNIGIAQKAAFRYEAAIQTLEKYLATATVSPSQAADVRKMLSEMRVLLSNLTITSHPSGATIAIDGVKKGAAPLHLRLPSGRHVIEAALAGHRPATKEILIPANTARNEEIVLEKEILIGTVMLRSKPAKAWISIDGTAMGATPLEVDLSAGGHFVQLTAQGYLTYRGDISIVANQKRELDIPLERPPTKGAFYHKWWFWTLGVAVAAGIAVGIGIPLSLRTEDPIAGTLVTSPVNR